MRLLLRHRELPGRFRRPESRGGLVAQSVEQCPFKALVQGSSPCQPTNPAREGGRRSPAPVFCVKYPKLEAEAGVFLVANGRLRLLCTAPAHRLTLHYII